MSAKGADARHQLTKKVMGALGGVLHTASLLREDSQ